MIKVLWRRFQKWLRTFTMLLFEGSSETGLFRHLYDNVFGVRNFGNTKSIRVIFCFKIFKFNLDFKNEAKKWIKVFVSEIIASELVLLNCLSHVNKRELFQLNWLGRDQWRWKKCCDADFNSAWPRLPCCLWKCPLKQDFLDAYLTTFSQSVI